MNASHPVTATPPSPVSTGSRVPASGRHRVHAASARLWHHRPLSGIGPQRIARSLGWFSIGLGLAELLAPRAIARLWGGDGRHSMLIRMYGVREIMSGLLIFSQGRRPTAGMWSRVAGDAMDLAALSAAAASPNTNRTGVAFAAANVLGVTALDVLCAQELSRRDGTLTEDGAVRVAKSIVINRERADIYRFWRDFENLPSFMYHLKSVRSTGPYRSHWVTSAPGGGSVEWESEIVADHPNELIAWRSVEGSEIENAGTVRFEPRPGGRGTIVRVELEYRPPGGIAGAAVASLFNQSPQQQLHDELRRLKQVLEIGEVVRSDGCPDGTGVIAQRPGQPLGEVPAPASQAVRDSQFLEAR
jgi:uncharacterized membrane protein